MKFTAQEEYGLRCLLEIARHPQGSMTIPEIAAREGLTVPNAAKLMRILRQANLVTSSRGQNGGYQLARPPDQLSMGMVLNALGGRLYSGDFCRDHTGTESVCVHDVDCSIRSLWLALDAAVERALSSMTLRDLLCTEDEMAARIDTPVTFPLRGIFPVLSCQCRTA